MSDLVAVDGIHGSAPRWSVAIPVKDGGSRLVELVRALAAQQVEGDVEVLLADSGSKDGAVEEAARVHSGARRFVVPEGRFGHGRTRRAMVAAARGEAVAFFSQDAVPKGADTLALLVQALQVPGAVGAWARQVPRPGADPLVAARLRRWTPEGVGVQLQEAGPTVWAAAGPEERLRLARYDHVCAMAPKWALLQSPLPDRDFGEDLVWAAAQIRAGRRIVYVPEAVVEHHHDPSVMEGFLRNRLAHRQVASEFGFVAVPSLAAALAALCTGFPGDLRDGGWAWACRGLPRRSGELLGQWAGARDARR